ncbi:hypothetical protein AB0C81_14220 [Streptomyces roseoverticillatus]|uniref:hypothetical protein n=1 Tax=Streptomyces roseoverticillatus TaxID=66429 RepID=UPI0033CE5646
MRTWRTPNQPLRSLLREAGWSGARLAREINALAREQHRSLNYDRSTVSHWLAGTRPRPPAPQLAAEAFSRRLGRRVGVADTGLALHEGAAAHERADTPADRLRQLGASRGEARDDVVHSPADSMLPLWEQWHPSRNRTAAPPPAGPPDLAVARAMLELFSHHEAWFGGDSARQALRAYLATNVSAWLEQDLRPSFRRELLTTAGHLAYLCAFTHFDANLQAAAQRYYLTAAELARHAGDRTGYAMAARGLSIQALSLGHDTDADLLAARAVRIGLPQSESAHQRAFFLGHLALTQARVGEHRASDEHFATAEAYLHEPEPERQPPIGSFHLGALTLQQAYAARARGDSRQEAAGLQASLRHRPRQERRGRALSLATLAEAQLDIGHLDLACGTWTSFLDLSEDLRSARVTDRLHALLARLRPYTANRSAAEVRERARALRPRHLGRRDTIA